MLNDTFKNDKLILERIKGRAALGMGPVATQVTSYWNNWQAMA